MVNLTEKIIAYIMQQLNQIGEDFGWQMGKVGANYENGYMKCNQDSKAHFRRDKIKKDIEKLLENDFVDSNKMVVTNSDRVRNMNDEELEAFIIHTCNVIKPDKKHCTLYCDECIAKWLKEKVE